MATLEEIKTEVRAEVEAEKPLNKSVDGVVSELTDDDYEQIITDRANEKYEQQQNGWIEDRIEAYGSIADQLDMQYWDSVNGTTTWTDHIAQVKADNPKPE
tara:strand:- start:1679 stop:1981 length:303 start_codon:yes stop_codon:yes gene_type:complete